MTSIEEKYFHALTAARLKLSEALNSYAGQGIKDGTVKKYAGKAHFLYELLQNADDAGATKARFVLKEDHLLFFHNGTRRFNISNPATEKEDYINGKKVGDINAITAIGGSNKKDSSTIGKFGVGFKAVFTYTDSPYIYDPVFKFKIEDFVVPHLLQEDHPARRKEETLFVFPFNIKGQVKSVAENEIFQALSNLSYPHLFLSNIKSISYQNNRVYCRYVKEILNHRNFDGTDAKLLKMSLESADKKIPEKIERLWLFSRSFTHETASGLSYCVGFFLDKDGKLAKTSLPAFCYFPTREETNLNFIIHAPFLLTDSRANILAGEKHNRDMVQQLAVLAADSLEFLKEIGEERNKRLIEDNILELIPYDKLKVTPQDSTSSISFEPFYTEILKKFKNAAILPSRLGYTEAANAYWADDPQIASLFSNEQLAALLHRQRAAWAFPSRGRDETFRHPQAPLREFIEAITHAYINETHILKGRLLEDGKTRVPGITGSFIEKQPLEWLDKFYQWVLRSHERRDAIKNLPIFLDQHRQSVAIYDGKGIKCLFLPDGIESDYHKVHPDLYKLQSARDLLKLYDVEKPSAKDYIYNHIFSQYYKNVPDIDSEKNFLVIFDFYKKCPQKDLSDLLGKLRELDWLCFRKASDPQKRFRGKPGAIYYPEDDLKVWFKPSPTTIFIDLDFYHNIIQENETAYFKEFLQRLGVNFSPAKIELINRGYYSCYEPEKPWPHSTKTMTWKEIIPEGAAEFLKYIANAKDIKSSLVIWRYLAQVCHQGFIFQLFEGQCSYYYYRDRTKNYDSYFKHLLLNTKWLADNNGNWVSPVETAASELRQEYFPDQASWELCEILGIRDELSHLETEAAPNNPIEALRMQLGLSLEDALAALQNFADKKTQFLDPPSSSAQEEDPSQPEDEETEEKFLTRAAKALERLKNRDRQENGSGFKEQSSADPVADEEQDADEYTPVITSLEKKMDTAREKAAKELEALANLQDLHKKIASFQKYSLGWLMALLELEILENNPNSLASREISIDFAKIEREPDTERTVILSQPSRNIPRMMEDLVDIPLELTLDNGDKIRLPIEVIHVKSYTLKVKLRLGKDLGKIDFSAIHKVHIEAQSPAFLLGELQKAFNELAREKQWNNTFNFRQNLPSNMEFIFGPPGTGKSTRLAGMVHDMLEDTEERPLNILILGPTNKACDVLATRLLDTLPTDASPPDWLVRFGVTGDEALEKQGILKPKTFDISNLHNMVVITTIARLPYDYFIQTENGERKYLKDLGWDYVIIDEASMIHLPYMLYTLFKCDPDNFIIAGDPFQIQPIAAVDKWKDENIFSIVELDSFARAKTGPIDCPVERLTTQYRARPEIGRLFSNFIYDGMLEHAREQEKVPPLPKDCDLPLRAINIIKFPVRKYESIYRSQRLNGGSPYHVYSALFAFELVKYLSSLSWPTNAGRPFSIGVIAPYRAQADIVAKLLEGFSLPNGVNAQVGTIHGFQGDECDAIIALFNSPPSLSASGKLFLNNPNIINVAISRARDFLFILMPDDATENLHNLVRIKQLEELCDKEGCAKMDAAEVENLILGDGTWLEDNSFATSHHDVNVYRKPEKIYEIRCESMAVDLQVLPNSDAL